MRISVTKNKKSKSFVFVTLVFMAAMCAVALTAAVTRNVEGSRYAALAENRKDVYAVICRGVGTRGTRETALEIFEELGVKAVFFISGKADMDAAKEVLSRGHAAGVDCSGTGGMNKSEFLLWLAKLNDVIFESTGRRPRFCYISGDACIYAREVCETYGQFCVTETASAGGSIERGDVVLCSLESEDSIRAFARSAAGAAENGIYPVGLYELFAEYGGVFIGRKTGDLIWENYLQNAQGVLK
ncbi:MAG: hypothetical protein J6U75_07005 [Clostridia bacterium]|nr:hypothetical protein [Clostridia bacterium]